MFKSPGCLWFRSLPFRFERCLKARGTDLGPSSSERLLNRAKPSRVSKTRGYADGRQDYQSREDNRAAPSPVLLADSPRPEVPGPGTWNGLLEKASLKTASMLLSTNIRILKSFLSSWLPVQRRGRRCR